MTSCRTCSIPNLRPPAYGLLFSLKSHCRAVAEFRAAASGNPADSRDTAPNRKRQISVGDWGQNYRRGYKIPLAAVAHFERAMTARP